MDGWDLFGGPDEEQAPVREKLSDEALRIKQNIQAMVAKHLGCARADLRSLGSKTEIESEITDGYQQFCMDKFEECFNRVDQASSLLWNLLLTQGWTHVCFRELYIISQVLKAFSGYANQIKQGFNQSQIVHLIQELDRAIILGAPPTLPLSIIELLDSNRVVESVASATIPKDLKFITHQHSLAFPVERISLSDSISLDEFRTNYYKKNLPVIFSGFNQWPAFDQWRELSMWCTKYGHRVVPVEIGKLLPSDNVTVKGSSSTWRESSMELQKFIENYMIPSLEYCTGDNPVAGEYPLEQIGYIAQHNLFNQFPELKNSFTIPEYCSVSSDSTNFDHVTINAWFGTHDTETTLHFDSYDNFLSQVIGFKYVRLYAPQYSDCLYPIKSSSGTAAQKNLSSVNVLHPDLERYSKFSSVPFTECILAPNEMLYIPNQWWHYVHSLSPSFSLNFWF